jgi:peroxiredoxin
MATKRVELNQPAPDFFLRAADGQQIKLSDFKEKSNVLLVFNRGFM